MTLLATGNSSFDQETKALGVYTPALIFPALSNLAVASADSISITVKLLCRVMIQQACSMVRTVFASSVARLDDLLSSIGSRTKG